MKISCHKNNCHNYNPYPAVSFEIIACKSMLQFYGCGGFVDIIHKIAGFSVF
jgi:hypothetical protein